MPLTYHPTYNHPTLFSSPLQGSFSLSSGAYATPPLPLNSSDATIAAALSLLPSVGQVLVRRQLGMAGAQLTLLVVFVEKLVGVPMLVASGHGLMSTVHVAPTNIHVSVNSLVLARPPILGSGYYNSTIVMVPTTPSTTMVSQSGDVMLSTAGLAPVTVRLEGLVEGLAYYVRVSAWNGAGDAYGAAQHGWPVLVVASSTPRAVTDVALTATSDSSLRVTWKAPASAGQGYGSRPPSAYTIDYDLAPTTTDVQVVSINASSAQLAGTFCLSFAGYSTSAIPFDASASRLESAIESLAAVGNVQVTQTLSQSANRYGIAWTVTFLDNVGPVSLLGVSCNDLAGSMVVINTYRVVAAPPPSFTGGSMGIFQVTPPSFLVPNPLTIPSDSSCCRSVTNTSI